jgi:hypothetical protein
MRSQEVVDVERNHHQGGGYECFPASQITLPPERKHFVLGALC